MSTSSAKAQKLLERIGSIKPYSLLLDDLKLDPDTAREQLKIPDPLSWTEESQQKRLDFLSQQTGADLSILSGKGPMPDPGIFQGNIEQYIGLTQVPTGVIGPLCIKGTAANGDFYVPLATSEGALIASYHRGAKATRLCGGIVSVCLTEGVQRAPLFKFFNLNEVGQFMQWVLRRIDVFCDIVSKTSRFAKLEDLRLNMEGNHVVLVFEYTTGDAAGQNMVTLCTEAICTYILEHTPIKPEYWFIESNYSGDKKATAL